MSLTEFETKALALLAEIRDAVSRPKAGGSAPIAVDIDGPHGDPDVRKDPTRWKGDRFAPCRMSEGSPEWLDVVANQLDWQAGKAEQENQMTNQTPPKPRAPYLRLDAARARAWAARIRGGWKPKPRASFDDLPDDDGFADAFHSANDEPF